MRLTVRECRDLLIPVLVASMNMLATHKEGVPGYVPVFELLHRPPSWRRWLETARIRHPGTTDLVSVVRDALRLLAKGGRAYIVPGQAPHPIAPTAYGRWVLRLSAARGSDGQPQVEVCAYWDHWSQYALTVPR